MAAPNNPRFVTMVMDLGLRSNPNLHRVQKGPFRVRIEARQRWVASTRVSRSTWFEADPLMFCDRNEKDDDWECQGRSLAADEGAAEKAEPTQLRNEAPLNCVSLRSELDDEVTCGAVKGQDERPFRAPLTAPQVTPELDAARKKTSKVSRQDRQNGGCCGSTELPVVAPERS
jgi:hypothetical protein